MTRLKKALSIALCLTMLLGTVAVGFVFASADNTGEIKSYSELVSEYTENFFYAGFEIYEGDELTDGAVSAGDTLHVKYYVKTDYTLTKGLYYLIIAADDTSVTTANYISSPPATGKALTIKTYSDNKTATAKTAKVTASYFPTYNVANWASVNISDILYTGARTANTDDPMFEFDIVLADTAAVLGNFKIFLVNEAFTAYTGSYTSGRPYETLNNSTKQKADNCEIITEPVSFSIGNAVTFNDAEGNEISKTTYAAGDTIVPPEGIENLYGWKDADGNLVDFSQTKMGSSSVTYTAVLTTDEVTYTFNGNGGTVNGEETLTVTKVITETLNLGDYAAEHGSAILNGWLLGDEQLDTDATYTPTNANGATFTAAWVGEINIMIYNLEDGWQVFDTLSGNYGDTWSVDLDNVVKAKVSDNLEEAEALTGVENVHIELKYIMYKNSSDKIVEITRTERSKVVFGETSEIYLSFGITLTLEKYYPVFDEDVEPTGDYELYNTVTRTYAFDCDKEAYTSTGNSDFSNDAAFVTFDSRQDEGTAGYFKRIEDDENVNFAFTSEYYDGEDNALTFYNVNGYYQHTLLISEFDEEGVFKLYTKPASKSYDVFVNVDANNTIYSTLKVPYGETIDISYFETMKKLSGADTEFSYTELKEDGASAGKGGYQLTAIYVGSEEDDALTGTVFTVDKEFVANYAKDRKDGNYYRPTIYFESSWEAKDYIFTVMYQNASGEWVELLSKKFSGDTEVRFANLIDEDAKAIIKSDILEGQYPEDSILDKEDGTTFTSAKAYEGPMTLKIRYNSETYYCYGDYNNNQGKTDEKGNPVPSTAYQQYQPYYGDIVYAPDYDEETYDGERPMFNSFLTYAPISTPKNVQKTDKDGNLVYEPLYREVVDEDGNVVINPTTGKPATEIVTDEEGNIVYDESKPVWQVNKGSERGRPYRNCEYVGWKVYHVEGNYKNFSDLPSEDKWIEGWGNDEYRAYYTIIMQIQWKNDGDFFFRVYDTENNIYSALGRDFKMYYWNKNKPCSKSEAVLNTDPESFIILFFKFNKEEANEEDGLYRNSIYFTPITLGPSIFSPAFVPKLIPTLVGLIKGLIA